MWNDVDSIPDPDYRKMDDQVEMRCKAKRLCDCELPEGFRLVTRFPKQYWLDHQLRWGFELCYTPKHMQVTTYRHVARYLQQVTDETQMHWALDDFTAELITAGVFRTEKQRSQTPRAIAAPALS
jgi:hypothetical protein